MNRSPDRLTLVLCAIASLLPISLLSQTPPPDRTILIEGHNKYAPVTLVAVSAVGNTYSTPPGTRPRIDLSDPSERWIGDLSLTVDNRSEKTVTAVEFNLRIPDWNPPQQIAVWELLFHFGTFPPHADRLADGTPFPDSSLGPATLAPGQPITLGLAPLFTQLNSWLAKPVSQASVHSILFGVRRIFFDDGTMWSPNGYFKPDPAHPGVYLPLPRSAPPAGF